MLCSQGVTASRRARLPNVLACRQTHCPSTSLTYAELIGSRRQGQSIICTASYDRMGGLLGFLMEDCCEGASEIDLSRRSYTRRRTGVAGYVHG
jgi:hypothetical protein